MVSEHPITPCALIDWCMYRCSNQPWMITAVKRGLFMSNLFDIAMIGYYIKGDCQVGKAVVDNLRAVPVDLDVETDTDNPRLLYVVERLTEVYRRDTHDYKFVPIISVTNKHAHGRTCLMTGTNDPNVNLFVGLETSKLLNITDRRSYLYARLYSLPLTQSIRRSVGDIRVV